MFDFYFSVATQNDQKRLQFYNLYAWNAGTTIYFMTCLKDSLL